MDTYFFGDLSLAQLTMISFPGVADRAIIVTRFDVVFTVEPCLQTGHMHILHRARAATGAHQGVSCGVIDLRETYSATYYLRIMISPNELVALILLIDIMCFIIIFNHCGSIMELSQAQLCLRLIITAKVFIPSRQHLTSDYLLKLFVLFQVISGPIPPMITG